MGGNGNIVDYTFAQVENDTRPYLKVSIFGLEIVGLLDSGATRTILGQPGWEVLRAANLKLHKAEIGNVVLANGHKVDVLGEVSLPIKLKDHIRICQVLVIPNLPHTLIFGADFWKLMGISVNLKDDSWDFLEGDTECHVSSLEGRSKLTLPQQQELDGIIENAKNMMGKGLGCANQVEHVIETSSAPIKQRYYPVSPAIQKIISTELDKMLEDNIVEPSNSAWASPIVMVKKKDGSYRFCVDYRKLNKVTKKDAYPLPYVTHTLDKLRNAKYMSSLDIKSAFWQVPMAEGSKQFTAFTVPGRGLFQFRRMPFGLTNSPATWQRLIDRVLAGELEQYVFVYLDDVIIITQSFEEHKRVLWEVLEKLCQAGLVINYAKCEFCRPELRYLGYVVGEQGLQVDPDKIKCILDIPSPKSVSEVRRFIGVVAWYRRFVPNFSSLIAPITELLKKTKKFIWSEACEEAFRKVKEQLVSAPILSCPDFDFPFIVHTDASGFGLGAVLTQEINGESKVVAYLSRSLNRCERNYSTTERECLAVLWAIDKLRPYLEGMKFTVVTDHASLVWLHNLKDPTGRLARWAMKMQQHDFEIIHRKGKEHLLPDWLSRSVPSACTIVEPNSLPDKWFSRMLDAVRKEPGKYSDWRIEDDKLYKHIRPRYPALATESDSWKEVVQKPSRKALIYKAHDAPLAGHCGVHKTYDRLCQNFYWPKMKQDVASYVRRCTVCQSTKPIRKRPAGHMAIRKIAEKPWEMLSIDLIGPLPRSNRGFLYILTVVDNFSKFPLLFPLRSATAKSVLKVLEDHVFLLFGVPRSIICDNGVQFRSKEFKNLCESYGVEISYTAYYHPQANPSERTNQVIKSMLRAYVADNHRNWDNYLAKIACAIRTATHEATKLTPFFVNFGREMLVNGKSHNFSNQKDVFDAEARSRALEDVRADVKRRLAKISASSCKSYNLRRRNVKYYVNDLVWRKNFVLSESSKYFNAKLAPKYIGPYKVLKIVSPWTYELADQAGKSQGIWHTKDLKPFVPGEVDD